MNENTAAARRAQAAMDNFKAGYNCAQSVILAFSDLLHIESDDLARLASPFGGGIGRMREVCGAVSGMIMVQGLLLGYSSPDALDEKKNVYAQTRSLAEEYKQQNGSIVCRELLYGVPHTNDGTPEQRSDEYYKKRPCAELVYTAAEIVAKHLINNGIEGV